MRYEGKTEDAMAAAAAGTTIPMASFTFTAAKDGLTYTDTIVGTSPFATTKTTSTINVLIVPVIVTIGSTTFDPTVADSCITPSMAPLVALQQSPLLQNVAFDGGAGPGHAATMNGINVGTTIYPDAFRRAEFWSKVAGSNYHSVDWRGRKIFQRSHIRASFEGLPAGRYVLAVALRQNLLCVLREEQPQRTQSKSVPPLIDRTQLTLHSPSI